MLELRLINHSSLPRTQMSFVLLNVFWAQFHLEKLKATMHSDFSSLRLTAHRNYCQEEDMYTTWEAVVSELCRWFVRKRSWRKVSSWALKANLQGLCTVINSLLTSTKPFKSLWQTPVKNANEVFFPLAPCPAWVIPGRRRTAPSASLSPPSSSLLLSPCSRVFWRESALKAALKVYLCLLSSGSALHAGWRSPPGNPTGPDSSHADAAQHHSNGPSAATWLPAHRRAHHRLLLLADRHHCDHQSSAG